MEAITPDDKSQKIFDGRLGVDAVEELSTDELSSLRYRTGKAITRLELFLNQIMLDRGELSMNHPSVPKGDPENIELFESRQTVGEEITRLWLILNAVMAANGELTRGHIKSGYARLGGADVHFVD